MTAEISQSKTPSRSYGITAKRTLTVDVQTMAAASSEAMGKVVRMPRGISSELPADNLMCRTELDIAELDAFLDVFVQPLPP